MARADDQLLGNRSLDRFDFCIVGSGAGGGVEGAENSLLAGSSDKLFYRRVSDILTGKEQTGASLELTINAKAQAAADKALGNQRGAVVALDPTTGEILALVSHPAYDPSVLSSHDTDKVVAAWKQLNAASTQPLVDRAIAGIERLRAFAREAGRADDGIAISVFAPAPKKDAIAPFRDLGAERAILALPDGTADETLRRLDRYAELARELA